MKEMIFVIEEDVESGYNAYALGASIFTQGETITEIKENIKDAVSCHFERDEDIPKVIRLHMVKEKVFACA